MEFLLGIDVVAKLPAVYSRFLSCIIFRVSSFHFDLITSKAQVRKCQLSQTDTPFVWLLNIGNRALSKQESKSPTTMESKTHLLASLDRLPDL